MIAEGDSRVGRSRSDGYWMRVVVGCYSCASLAWVVDGAEVVAIGCAWWLVATLVQVFSGGGWIRSSGYWMRVVGGRRTNWPRLLSLAIFISRTVTNFLVTPDHYCLW